MSLRVHLLRALWLACVCLAAGQAHAEIPDDLRGRTIVELGVAGENEGIEPPREAGISLGDKLTRSLLREAITKVLATGRFVDVQLDAQPVTGGVRLVFTLEPKITLRRVSISGNEHMDDDLIDEVIDVGAGTEIEDNQLEIIAGNIRKLYAEHGYLGARALVRFRDTDDASIKVLMIEIDEAAPTLIGTLTFSGQRPLDKTAVLDAMGLSIGNVLDRKLIAESAQKGEQYLRTHGYLEASLKSPVITIAGERAGVAFPTHIGPRYTLEVRGAGPLLARDVIEVLALPTERLTPETLEAMRAHVKDLYAKNGFLDARVALETRMLQKRGRAQLIVHVDPGSQIEIVDANFRGATHFPQKFLQDQLFSYLEEDLPGADLIDTVDSEVADQVVTGDDGKIRQVHRPMNEAPTRTYYGPTYKEALKHITEVYQAEGYLDVKVGPDSLERVGATRATVSVPIVEGPRTLVQDVVLSGQRLIPGRDLIVASGMVRNQPFSYLLLEEARLRMQSTYHERGHMFVKIEPGVRFSHDRTRAEVSFVIVERFPVYIGDIVVRGAERTSAKFLESLLDLKRGDLFRPSKARDSENTLRSLGVFTGASVALLDPDLPARVKTLLVTVSERKNQFLDFSAGLSTGQGIRAGFEYGYRNLFDRAVGLTLRVNFAHQLFFVQDDLRRHFEALPLEKRLERNISLGAVIPRLPGLGSTRTNIDLVHVRDNERDFGLDKNGVTLGFTETPWKRITLLEAADLENNSVDLFTGEALNEYLAMTTDPRLRRLLRVPEGNTTLVALRTQVSYDQRDSPFNPTRGFFASASSELASTLSSEEVDIETGKTQFFSRFLKMQMTGSGYVPLGRSVVLAGQVRVGRIVHLQNRSETYPNRAFFLGGIDTMRGYFQDELIPQDIAEEILRNPKLSPNAIVRSGDAFVLVKGELRFPIYGQLGGGLFTDIGNLWADAANLNPFDLRPTAGAGLRLATPVGPIAVDYGIVLKRRRGLGEPFGTLAFSIGLF